MRKEVIWIGIIVFIVSVIIYLVKNYNSFISFKLKRYITDKLVRIICIIILIILGVYMFRTYDAIKSNINSYTYKEKIKEEYKVYENNVYEENIFYKSVINKNYEMQMYNKPYIFEDFCYGEGEWNTGFVIEDKDKNQYVWVPCSNIENIDVPKLEKKFFSAHELISKDYCYDLKYKDFLNSALENGGFYISRYEIGNENQVPVSKPNVQIWNNISQENAMEISSNMYKNNNGIISELINGYAYDSVLDWIYKTNTVAIGDYNQNDNIITGRNYSYNNIYDITDNILELTMERNYDTSIVRGMYVDKAFDNYLELVDSNVNIYSNIDGAVNTYTSFRIILYK